jgi:histidinol-phosphate aminotransferase
VSGGDPRVTPRPLLRRLPPAEHGGPSGMDDALPPVRVDFSTSINAYGPAASVVAALSEALAPASMGAYPDPTSRAARAALAAHTDADADAIAVGAGAAELILSVMLAFVRAGDRVLVPPHAFGEYARAAALCGAQAIMPPAPAGVADPDGPVDALVASFARALRTGASRIAVLCTPESPLGRAWPMAAVREIAEACGRAGTLLLLDQSFDAFAAAPLGTPALADHPATLHLRSLTKDHALAGVRAGYLVGPLALVAAVERARVPWAASAPTQAAVVAACAPDAHAHVRRTTGTLRADAAALRDACRSLGARPVVSDVHYFLLDVGDAAAVAGLLRARHAIKVRDCRSFGLPGHVRIAARTPGENRLLLDALADVLPRVTGPASSRPPAAPHA